MSIVRDSLCILLLEKNNHTNLDYKYVTNPQTELIFYIDRIGIESALKL